MSKSSIPDRKKYNVTLVGVWCIEVEASTEEEAIQLAKHHDIAYKGDWCVDSVDEVVE